MATATLTSTDYSPVATATLCASAVLDCDLYTRRGNGRFFELYRGGGYPFQQSDLDRLHAEGIDRLYIQVSDRQTYEGYLRREVLDCGKRPAAVRLKALRELMRVTFDQALQSSDTDEIVTAATDFGCELCQLASERSIVFHQLYGTLEHDYYTFTHVCNVGVYSVLIASRLGYSQAHLEEIAVGALLHDIGKRHVPPTILNKPGKLTDAEWHVVREHPLSGFRELITRPGMSWPQLMMVYQHHERLDGTGYPVGIEGDEMHPWAKLCAVADVFDALTCHRPYRNALPVSEACAHLEQHAGTWFDKDIVQCCLTEMRRDA